MMLWHMLGTCLTTGTMGEYIIINYINLDSSDINLAELQPTSSFSVRKLVESTF